jgi:hypothetical protein
LKTANLLQTPYVGWGGGQGPHDSQSPNTAPPSIFPQLHKKKRISSKTPFSPRPNEELTSFKTASSTQTGSAARGRNWSR